MLSTFIAFHFFTKPPGNNVKKESPYRQPPTNAATNKQKKIGDDRRNIPSVKNAVYALVEITRKRTKGVCVASGTA